MKYNLKNYEQYAIDYLDGKLSPSDTAEFLAFLIDHPELEAELNELKTCQIKSDQLAFTQKDGLKKTIGDVTDINPKNFDEFCIGYLEHDLNPQAEKKLQDYIDKHPGSENRFLAYQNIRLKPDTKIQYPGKNDLKHLKVLPIRRIVSWSAAAAAIVTAVLIFRGRSVEETQQIPIAQQQKDIQYEEQKAVTPSELPEEKVSVVKTTNRNMEQLAAVDSSNPINMPVIQIAEIEPKTTNLEVPEQIIELTPPSTYSLAVKSVQQVEVTDEKRLVNPDQIVSKIKDLKPLDIVQASVEGINKLTESDLSVDAETDENGRIRKFSFRGNNFSLGNQQKSQLNL